MYDRLTKIEYIKDTGHQHIAVISGGISPEREVCLASCKQVVKSLVELGYKVTKLDKGRDIASAIVRVKPDIVFIALHGTYGEDGALQGMLNIMQIPYTHCGLLASAISFNKDIAKQIFQQNNILVPRHMVISKNNMKNLILPRPPYIIKPISQGSSVGVKIINDKNYFISDLDFKYGDKIMVEEYIEGKEIHVAILNGKALGAMEIKLLNSKFLDYKTKYSHGYAEHIYPARITDEQIKEVLLISEKANKSVNARGVTRTEFILSNRDNKFYLLEINTHPGLTEFSIVPEIVKHNNISFNELITILIKDADYER